MARILVAEDERDIATLIRFLLEQEGHSVEVVHNGAEVLRTLGVEPPQELPPPDLAILDLMMPVMDGLAVCRKLAENPRTRPIPLLVLTGKGEARSLLKGVHGVAALIPKPFDPRVFREEVARALGKAR